MVLTILIVVVSWTMPEKMGNNNLSLFRSRLRVWFRGTGSTVSPHVRLDRHDYCRGSLALLSCVALVTVCVCWGRGLINFQMKAPDNGSFENLKVKTKRNKARDRGIVNYVLCTTVKITVEKTFHETRQRR